MNYRDYFKDKTTVVLMVLLVSVLVFLFAFNIGGYTAFSVVSESMSPSIDKGSLVINQKKAFHEIETGDVITYQMNNTNMYVTHRVIEKMDDRVLCKGDANKSSDDQFVQRPQYEGNMVACIPYLGYISMFVKSTGGFLLCLLILVLLVISIVRDVCEKETQLNILS